MRFECCTFGCAGKVSQCSIDILHIEPAYLLAVSGFIVEFDGHGCVAVFLGQDDPEKLCAEEGVVLPVCSEQEFMDDHTAVDELLLSADINAGEQAAQEFAGIEFVMEDAVFLRENVTKRLLVEQLKVGLVFFGQLAPDVSGIQWDLKMDDLSQIIVGADFRTEDLPDGLLKLTLINAEDHGGIGQAVEKMMEPLQNLDGVIGQTAIQLVHNDDQRFFCRRNL